MKNSKLQKEQVELKKKLAELVDFITSEEYYALSEGERSLINQQRVGMELYLGSLTKRLYGESNTPDTSNLMWMTLLFGMFNSPSSGFGDTDVLKKGQEENSVPEGTVV